jgi:rhodanese-related sulfurtransferase
MSRMLFGAYPTISAARGTQMSRHRRVRSLSLGAAVLALALGASGCASSPAPIEPGADTVIVDVRTPAEYAVAHLDRAVNIDFRSPSFDDAVADLDSDADYVVYCQSGNRSARAVSVMVDAGLAVQDAGGIEEAAKATGLSVVP